MAEPDTVMARAEHYAFELLYRGSKNNVIILRLMDGHHVCAIVQAYTAPSEERIYISDVCTYRGYERQGLATYLLQQLFAWAAQNGYKKLQLDDCSDLFCHPKNLYLKLGFRYLVDGQPEMERDV
jgi:GNAT superfamily N-acetyltransferase